MRADNSCGPDGQKPTRAGLTGCAGPILNGDFLGRGMGKLARGYGREELRTFLRRNTIKEELHQETPPPDLASALLSSPPCHFSLLFSALFPTRGLPSDDSLPLSSIFGSVWVWDATGLFSV